MAIVKYYCICENVPSLEPADIAFLLDGSGSVTANQFTAMKTFVKNIAQSLLQLSNLVSLTHHTMWCNTPIFF